MRHLRVREWMTATPRTITPTTTLPEAYRIMKEMGIRRLPVVDRGRVVGIVTWGDVRQASASDATSLSIWELNYLLNNLTVKEVMTQGAITVQESDTIESAAKKMLQHKVSGLPVLSGADLVGIITESDIFRMVVQQWEEDAEEPEAATS